ncbi:MAG: hypothetical protein JRC60_07075, partial [Deltaproteobacteria bacterium]|nr:hypothetical protein [Deltaproteobacteria bacterium]
CPHCGSDNVEGITRAAGYFSRVSSWNRGKLAELRDRRNRDRKNKDHVFGGSPEM